MAQRAQSSASGENTCKKTKPQLRNAFNITQPKEKAVQLVEIRPAIDVFGRWSCSI